MNYAVEGKQKRFIKNAFRQYLSPEVVEQLIAHPEFLKLGGERRTLSIFFSDLQGFTAIAEGLDPEALTALLNEYLSAMTDIIHEEGGTLDKYVGDAIIAFWNAPLEQPDHAERAARAAVRCQAKLSELRPVIREKIGKDLFMRIGLNTGSPSSATWDPATDLTTRFSETRSTSPPVSRGSTSNSAHSSWSRKPCGARWETGLPPGNLPGRRGREEGTGEDLRAVAPARIRCPPRTAFNIRQGASGILRGKVFRGPRVVPGDGKNRSPCCRLCPEMPGLDRPSAGVLEGVWTMTKK